MINWETKVKCFPEFCELLCYIVTPGEEGERTLAGHPAGQKHRSHSLGLGLVYEVGTVPWDLAFNPQGLH